MIVGVAYAHDGPPYPILSDAPLEALGARVSVWTDPDIGIGTFYVQVAPLPGRALASDLGFQIAVRPESGAAPPETYQARLWTAGASPQYYAEVRFPFGGPWRVAVTGFGGAGGEARARLEAVVDVLPPGLGQWDLALYGLPFVLIAALAVAVRRRRASRRTSP